MITAASEVTRFISQTCFCCGDDDDDDDLLNIWCIFNHVTETFMFSVTVGGVPALEALSYV